MPTRTLEKNTAYKAQPHKQSCVPNLVYNIAYKATMAKFFWKRVLHTEMDIFSTHVFI